MKYIKKFEDTYKDISKRYLNYEVGDYVLPKDKSRKDCYVIIVEITGGWSDYIVEDHDIFTGNTLSRYPVMDNEIERKLTPEEIYEIEIKRNAKKYNL